MSDQKHSSGHSSAARPDRPRAHKRLHAPQPGEADPPPPARTSGIGRLFRLAVSCPRCGSRPALRVTEEVVRGVARRQVEMRLGTYQCHRRGCGTIYDLYLDRRLLEDEGSGVV